jgi:hypothetical protein
MWLFLENLVFVPCRALFIAFDIGAVDWFSGRRYRSTPRQGAGDYDKLLGDGYSREPLLYS